jgi:hypothetical protein
MPSVLTGANIAFVLGKPFSSTELIKLTVCFSVKYHRQSRWLVFMNRSKRLILEPPKGGLCA